MLIDTLIYMALVDYVHLTSRLVGEKQHNGYIMQIPSLLYK